MKKAITTILICLSITAIAQRPERLDTLRESKKTDTLYLVEFTDTVIQDYVLYDGGNNVVKFSRPGYVIMKGYKKNVRGKMQWSGQPKVVGLLDNKKKRVTPLFKTDQ